MNASHPFGDPVELATLYAAGAMTDGELAAFELHLAECDQCAVSLADLGPAVGELLEGVAPVPPDARVLKGLLARIDGDKPPPAGPTGTRKNGHGRAGAAAEVDQQPAPGSPISPPSWNSAAAHAPEQPRPQSGGADSVRRSPATPPRPQVWKEWADDTGSEWYIQRAGEAAWESLDIEGISIRHLFVDRARDQTTMLVRMAPGTAYPGHCHAGLEECYVLQGELHVGDTILRAGDYQRAARGSHHGKQWTEKGCLLLIVSSLSDELEEGEA